MRIRFRMIEGDLGEEIPIPLDAVIQRVDWRTGGGVTVLYSEYVDENGKVL